jgi:hypothetical protein
MIANASQTEMKNFKKYKVKKSFNFTWQMINSK